jgi:DNA-binding CsgD family transcriptional regulator
MSTARTEELRAGHGSGAYVNGKTVELERVRARRRRSGPGGLTRREVEVLSLVSRGWTNRTVARTLWVTDETVKFHLSNIYRKLGVANRAEASQWAAECGIAEGAIEMTPLDLRTS